MNENRFTAEQKREIVVSFLSKAKTPAELCRDHQISSTTLYNWRDAFLEGGTRSLEGKGVGQRELGLEREVERLRRIAGDLALANHLLKGGSAGSTGNQRGGGLA